MKKNQEKIVQYNVEAFKAYLDEVAPLPADAKRSKQGNRIMLVSFVEHLLRETVAEDCDPEPVLKTACAMSCFIKELTVIS